jgi:hypothetical protein
VNTSACTASTSEQKSPSPEKSTSASTSAREGPSSAELQGGALIELLKLNKPLKAKLDALCSDIAAHLDASPTVGGERSAADEVSYRSTPGSADWWPAGLGRPGAVGAQNDLRYAVFSESRRLVIDDHGAITVYDTGSHRIFGAAQAQSSDQTLSFTSEDGLVRVVDMPKLAR